MEILLVAATPFEVAPTLSHLEQNFERDDAGVFSKKDLRIHVLITGVGMVATSFQLGHHLTRNRPDLAINVGIAGTFDRQLHLGDVLHVTSERFADLGVEEADGRFTDLFALGLLGPDAPPYQDGALRNLKADQAGFLPSASGLTVNRVHGYAPSIAAVRERYPDVQVESMEGAAFFYACLMAEVPFLEIRSISNFVEPRNRDAWDLPLAIGNLNQVLAEILGAWE